MAGETISAWRVGRNRPGRRPGGVHAGQFATLGEVLRHDNRAPAAPSGHAELEPLKLNARELGQLEAFLRSLAAARWSRRLAGERRLR